MQRHISGVSSSVERLKAHPLVETITQQTHIVRGGWANGFIFVPDVKSNKCVIIDPGTSNELEGRYRAKYSEAVRGVVENVDLRKVLQSKHERMELLRIIGTEMNHAVDRNGIGPLFLERATVLANLVVDCGLDVTMVLATHHHIDHLGSGHELATRLGVKCYLPNPHIFETDKLRDLYPVEQRVGMYSGLEFGAGPYGIKIWNLGGHTEMVGFLLPDGNLIVGDLIGTKGMWDCSVLYMEDIRRHVASLYMVGALGYERMLLSHGTRYVLTRPEALELVRVNERCVNEAIGAAKRNEDDVAAAESYLKPNGDVGVGYIGHALVTARHIGAYR